MTLPLSLWVLVSIAVSCLRMSSTGVSAMPRFELSSLLDSLTPSSQYVSTAGAKFSSRPLVQSTNGEQKLLQLQTYDMNCTGSLTYVSWFGLDLCVQTTSEFGANSFMFVWENTTLAFSQIFYGDSNCSSPLGIVDGPTDFSYAYENCSLGLTADIVTYATMSTPQAAGYVAS